MRLIRFQPGPKAGDWIVHCHWPSRLMKVSETGDYIWANFYDRGSLHTRIVERQCLYTVEPGARELAEWARLSAPPAKKVVAEHRGLPHSRTTEKPKQIRKRPTPLDRHQS